MVAATVNAGDVFAMRGRPWLVRFAVGFPKPNHHVLGWDAAGFVAAVGKKVTRTKSGEAVYCACRGAFAEYACAREDAVAMKPPSLGFEQAAAVPTAGFAALKGLRDVGKVRPGQRVLINGASGGVGTFAVQIAKALGAEVTGVCSARNVEMVRALGADHVVDYSKEDFIASGQRYDLILDNAASRSFSDLRRALTPQGVIVPNSGHGGMRYVLEAFALAPFFRQHAKMCKMGNLKEFTRGTWLGIAVLMVVPILMIVLSLLLPHPINRWANIVVATGFFLFNLIGLPTYPGAYDEFLLVVGLGFNVLTVWCAWNWA